MEPKRSVEIDLVGEPKDDLLNDVYWEQQKKIWILEKENRELRINYEILRMLLDGHTRGKKH